MSRSLRETGENRKPPGRGGVALASPSPFPASPRRAAAAAAAAPWGASSPAAGSRPRAASCRSSRREPGKTRRPASRRRRSTAGTCEPRYRPGCWGWGWDWGYRLSQRGSVSPSPAARGLRWGVCSGKGVRLPQPRCYGSVRAVQCVSLNN